MTAAAAPVALSRILVVKLADRGDALLATPAIRALRGTFPDARIDALTAPSGAAVLTLCPFVDRVIPFAKGDFDAVSGALRPRALATLGSLALRLRLARYDAVVLLHHLTTRAGTLKFRALCLAAGAPVRAGLDNGRGSFLTHRAVDYGFGFVSELDYGLRIVATLGAMANDRRPAIDVPNDAHQFVERLLEAEGMREPFVVIHPSVGGYSTARNWSPERFAALAERLRAEAGLRTVLVGAEDARAAAAVIRERVEAIDLIGRTSMAELAALLCRARIVVGADSGVVHFAAALDTPTVAIFGPSNQDAWRPYGAEVVTVGSGALPESRALVVRAGIPCSPCFYTGYTLGRRDGCPTRTCLDLVTTDEVARIALHLVRSTEATRNASGRAETASE